MHCRRNSALAGAIVGTALLLGAAAGPASAPSVFREDLSGVAEGKLPDDLLVLAGEFAVRGEAGEKMIVLAPDPIDTFGFLFGPAEESAVAVSAEIGSATTGRRSPEFGIGAGDSGGYKLWVLPGQQRIELRRGDEARGASSFIWDEAKMTHLTLRIIRAGNAWRIEGKAWSEGTPEPEKPTVATEDKEAPTVGRASVWGVPLSEKPIRFVHLSVEKG